MMKRLGKSRVLIAFIGLAITSHSYAQKQGVKVLQPGVAIPPAVQYLPSSPDTVRWGYLPNKDAKPVMTVKSGTEIIIDTVSHEGILEDQGRDPVRFFGKYGIRPEDVLEDAKAIARSVPHDFDKDGPHVVTGPIAIDGAQPGDVLKVEVLELTPRVPYGVISNRHGKGALPGELPANQGRQPEASPSRPHLYYNVSIFTPIRQIKGTWYGILYAQNGDEIRFPLRPFLGIMGVAPNTSERVNSIPPAEYGGNMDVKYVGVGATVYLPVFVQGALFYVGDPHFVQGNGEVALTALEGSLRARLRLSLLRKGDAQIPGGKGTLVQPFIDLPDAWVPIGLDPDLDEAMKKATREAIAFVESLGLDRATAYAYLSVAGDFEVSQVVDRTKGIHALISKAHFSNLGGPALGLTVNGRTLPQSPKIVAGHIMVPLQPVAEALGARVMWDSSTSAYRVLLVNRGELHVFPRSREAQWNGTRIGMDWEAEFLEEGNLFVPAALFAEILGVQVSWDIDRRVIHMRLP